MMTDTKAIHKAARLLVLHELQQAGLLEGLTARALGELLDCDAATAHRAKRDLATAQAIAPAILAEARRRLEPQTGADCEGHEVKL